MSPATGRTARDPVAVVGMGIVVPGACTPDGFWRLLLRGTNVFTEPGKLFPIEHFHSAAPSAPDKVTSRLAGYVHHDLLPAGVTDAAADDRSEAETWLRFCLRGALAGVRMDPGSPVLCSAAVQPAVLREFEFAIARRELLRTLSEPGERAPRSADPPLPARWFPTALVRSAMRGLLPDSTEVLVVDSACSSGLVAIDAGVRALWCREFSTVVCAAAISMPITAMICSTRNGGQSASGEIRPFDEGADGTVFADGAVALVLKPLQRARRDGDRVHGLVLGTGIAHDGRGKAMNAPNAEGQARAMTRALRSAALPPTEVGWFVAHGTGAPLGDATEVASLRRAYPGPPRRFLTSTKSVVGHGSPAAGPASVVHALLGLRHRLIPAQGHHSRPAEACALGGDLRVPTEHTPFGADGIPPVVGVNGFGLGGTNVHLLLGAAERVPATRPSSRTVTPPWSAARNEPEPLAVVALAADVPGGLDSRAFPAWLSGARDAPPPFFVPTYPPPAKGEFLIPGSQLRALDQSHISAMRLFRELTRDHLDVMAGLRATTGVFTAHCGPTETYLDTVLRCHLDSVRRSPEGRTADPSGRRGEAAAARLRAEVDLGPYALAGMLISTSAASVARYFDLSGPAFAVEGPDAGARAVRAAGLHLDTGTVDVAFVSAFNSAGAGRAEPVRSWGTHAPTGEPTPADGGFAVLLTRPGTARAHGLPVIASLDPGRPAGTAPARDDNGILRKRTYGCADSLLRLLQGHPQNRTDTAPREED
ncbi:beta-ketoacyl synthase N-terminal-like domain-containing protein [Kitasatospora sp. NPDC059463]|uniref:polyketide synthase n=1 Tax=unclassified Kitasatospora TaxID=2633591 RepID=UPI00369F46D7